MVVHKFSTFLFEAIFAFLHHQFLPKGAFQCRLDCERIKDATTVSGEHLEELNVVHCNKALL